MSDLSQAILVTTAAVVAVYFVAMLIGYLAERLAPRK